MSTNTVIDDLEVSTQPLAPLRGLALKAKLTALILPALAKGGPLITRLQAGGAERLDKLDVAELAPIIGELMTQIDPDRLPELVTQVLATTSVTVVEKGLPVRYELGAPGMIDRIFMTRSRALYAVIWHALKVHFADFIGGARSTVS